MEPNVIVNEEVVENVTENVVEEVATTNSGKAAKIAVTLGVVTLGGVLLYKKVIKPVVAKIKAKKEACKVTETETDEVDESVPHYELDGEGNLVEQEPKKK